MVIKTLSENTALLPNFESEHGLSLFIETKSRKILFDVGAGELFLKNAKKLGVDIADVDFLVISHGHYDHGGGLGAFLRENKKAKVFLHRLAFEKYYAERPNGRTDFIGLDENLKENKRIMLTSDRFSIDKGIEIFSNIIQKEPQPKSNQGLLKEKGTEKPRDNFLHEQILVIEEDEKTLLLTGCAHNGIINIIEHFKHLKGRMPSHVVGGFHLSSRSGGEEDADTIDKIGKYLMKTGAQYYTCHCTGEALFKRLLSVMGKRIGYLSAGSEITI